MRFQNIYCLILFAGLLAMSGCTSTSQKTIPQNPNAYSGKWKDGSTTSLEVITEEPLVVRHCYRTTCVNRNPTGTLDNMTFNFPAKGDRRAATMNAVKIEAGYTVAYQLVGATRVDTTTLAKPILTPAQTEPVLTPAQ